MRFNRFVIPGAYPDATRYLAYMERVKQHWRSLGWEAVPKDDEPAIEEAWIRHLEQVPGVVEAPKPSQCWRHVSIAELGQDAEEVEADFTLKILAAFRRCTVQGERLLAIDWLHSLYYFDPHGGISVATRDEWAMPVLPDIESYNYVAQDFRFGVLTGYDKNWFVKLFGANLLAAFAADLPKRFLGACGSGVE
jgi:hypothetical protein